MRQGVFFCETRSVLGRTTGPTPPNGSEFDPGNHVRTFVSYLLGMWIHGIDLEHQQQDIMQQVLRSLLLTT